MKKIFALLVCGLAVLDQLLAWVCGGNLSLFEHSVLAIGVFAIGGFFVKNSDLSYWKDTISSTGSSMVFASIAMIFTQALALEISAMGEVLQAMPVWFLLTGASVFLWTEICIGHFRTDVSSAEPFVKTTTCLCTALATLVTLDIINVWVTVPESLIWTAQTIAFVLAIAWICVLVVFLWNTRND